MSGKQTPDRCDKCRWIDEADSTAGTHYRGVLLCRVHAAAPEMLEALRDLLCGDDDMDDSMLCRWCGRDYSSSDPPLDSALCPDDDCPAYRGRAIIRKASGA